MLYRYETSASVFVSLNSGFELSAQQGKSGAL